MIDGFLKSSSHCTVVSAVLAVVACPDEPWSVSFYDSVLCVGLENGTLRFINSFKYFNQKNVWFWKLPLNWNINSDQVKIFVGNFNIVTFLKKRSIFLGGYGIWEWIRSGGSKGGGARDACPPLAEIFFIFMQFLGKICQIIGWRPPFGVSAPSSEKSWIRYWIRVLLNHPYYVTMMHSAPNNLQMSCERASSS